MVIFDRLRDFRLAVHDEGTVGGHGLVYGSAVEDQQGGVLPGFDLHLVALAHDAHALVVNGDPRSGREIFRAADLKAVGLSVGGARLHKDKG